MANYRTLKAWQHAHRLAVRCSRADRAFPSEERFGLADQLRRAANGVALQIAEGNGRDTLKDFRRFLIMARASLDEVDEALTLAWEQGSINKETYDSLQTIRRETGRTLHGLIGSVDRRMDKS